MDDDDWDELIGASRRLLNQAKESHRLLVENYDLIQNLVNQRHALEKVGGDQLPEEYRQIWREYDDLKRHQKAFWLRVILDDYEY